MFGQAPHLNNSSLTIVKHLFFVESSLTMSSLTMSSLTMSSLEMWSLTMSKPCGLPLLHHIKAWPRRGVESEGADETGPLAGERSTLSPSSLQ